MPVLQRRLLRDHEIRLTVWGDGGQKFVRLFRACWDQLPYKARRLILTYWKSGKTASEPLIELSDMWVDSKTSFAQVTDQGTELRFSARDFALLPVLVARWVVAHELAHVYQKALGRRPGGVSEPLKRNRSQCNRQELGLQRRAVPHAKSPPPKAQLHS